MEASLLDSGVQELFETEDLGAYGLTSSTLCVVRGCSNATAVRFHSQRLGAEAVRQELHILQILAADLESLLENVSEIRGEFIQLPPDERPLHTTSFFHSTASTHAIKSKGDAPAAQPLYPVGVRAKSIAVLDKLRSARSLVEEFGVDPGVARTKLEYT